MIVRVDLLFLASLSIVSRIGQQVRLSGLPVNERPLNFATYIIGHKRDI